MAAPETAESAEQEVPVEGWAKAKAIVRKLGPGLVTGASDDDPSGIGTYAMAGAATGYATLWLALFTFPLMAAVQYICAKIGLVAGTGLATIIRIHYPRWVLWPTVLALVAANIINAAADLAAISAGINLLVPIPITLMILPVGVLIVVILVWGSYQTIARIFKWLTLALLAYIGSALLAGPDWGQVLTGTLIPTFRWERSFLEMLVAILGTTISPYLFFWQANHEVEASNTHAKRYWWRHRVGDSELEYAAWDVNIGMFLSNVVMYFIILATAATLHENGKTDVASATEAAEALKPLAGDAAFFLMALGLIGSGFLAVPILIASGAYAMAEAMKWKSGLDEKPGRAKAFYVVIAVSMAVAIGMNYLGIDPMRALFWTSVINGFLSPPLLVIVMLIANNKRVMGKRVNGPLLNVLGWATTALMFAAAIVLVWIWISEPDA